MISYAITFFILAIIAAVLGFGGLAGTFSGIAQLFLVLFAVLFIASLLVGAVRGGRTPMPPA